MNEETPGTVTIERPTRRFKQGSVEWPDPDPTLDPEQVKALLARALPHLRHCTVEEPKVEGGELVYEFSRPPVKRNG